MAQPDTPEDDEVVAASASPDKPEAEREWWDDPSLPWKHKPTKTDLACWAWIAVVGIYGLVLLPLRPILLGMSPPVAAAITGGRTSVVATGAFWAVDGGPILLYWLLATLSIVKFDWVYWWAGKLWGEGLIEILAGRSKRSKRNADRAVRVTRRFQTLAIALTYLPIPFPRPIVFAALGAAGTSIQRTMGTNIACAAVVQAIYLAIGWRIGEPAVALVKLYADYMLYVTIAILVGMVVAWWWRRRSAKADADAK